MNCYIASLKYAPGLAKEIKLLGSKLSGLGLDVVYLLSSGYQWLVEGQPDIRGHIQYVSNSENVSGMLKDTALYPWGLAPKLKKLFSMSPPHILILYNPHPLNFDLCRLAKAAYPSGVRSVYLHEPFKPDKSLYSTTGALYFRIVEGFQSLSLRYINHIIVPSPYASSLFALRYPRFEGEIYTAPIILPEPQEDHSPGERTYISLVGTINSGRGLNLFLDLINHASQLRRSMRFQIVTRSSVSRELQVLSAEARSMLHLVNQSHISDETISNALKQSIALFLPHTDVTQSGNVPVSFQCGTPVIARDIPGFSQHIQHKKNGYLVSPKCSVSELLLAVDYVDKHFDGLSTNAQKSYADIFGEHNWTRYYQWLIDYIR